MLSNVLKHLLGFSVENFTNKFDLLFYFPLFLIMIMNIIHRNIKIKLLKNFKPKTNFNHNILISTQDCMKNYPTFKLQIMKKLVLMKLVTNRKELYKYVHLLSVELFS